MGLVVKDVLWELRDIGLILPHIKRFRNVIWNQQFTSFAIKLDIKRGIELLLEFLLNPNSRLVQRFSLMIDKTW